MTDITYRQTYVPSRTLTLTKVAIQSISDDNGDDAYDDNDDENDDDDGKASTLIG